MSDWIEETIKVFLAEVEDDGCFVEVDEEEKLVAALRAAHSQHCPHKAEVERLRKLCGEVAEDGEEYPICKMYLRKLRAASEGEETSNGE